MEKDPINDDRFKKIERKLTLLFGLAIAQLAVLLFLTICLVIKQFMPSTFSMILFFVVLAAFLYFFRAQIPGWFGNASRIIFAQIFAAQKNNSMKDIK